MATNANNEYDKANTVTDDIPQGGDTIDNSYATGSNAKGGVPVLKDETPVEQPNDARNPDSDQALGKSIDPQPVRVYNQKLINERRGTRLKPSTKATSSKGNVPVVPSRLELIKSRATRRVCQDRMMAGHPLDNLGFAHSLSSGMG
jgi:hypothetical protein